MCSGSERIQYFTFGHIVPKENLIAMSVSGGPSGAAFDFTYHNRNNLVFLFTFHFLLSDILLIIRRND